MHDPSGILFVTMEPPAASEEEFNAWYDTEHVPERATTKGFINALRFVCVDGWPKYAAAYDLDTPGVLNSEAYNAISGPNFSPWSKRIAGKVSGQWRFGGRQLTPGSAVTGQHGAPAFMLMIRWRQADADWQPAVIQGLHRSFQNRAGVLQTRAFANDGDFLALVESKLPLGANDLDLGAFGPSAAGIDRVNLYVPYWRRGDD